LIPLVLQVITGVAILLGLVIAVELGYLLYKRGMKRVPVRVPTILPKAEERIEETVRLIRSVGTLQAVTHGYREVKRALVSLVGLEEKKGRTEREVVQEIMANPTLKSVQDELERIYRTYERVRFGSQGISRQEVELFLGDLREVYRNLVEKGYEEQVVG